MWLLLYCGLYRVCSPLSCGGFQKLLDGFWSRSVAFKMASHSGSYSRCSEEPGLSATSTICNIKIFIHSQRSTSCSTTRSTTSIPQYLIKVDLEICLLMETAGSLPEGSLDVEDTCQVRETWWSLPQNYS